MKRNLKEEMEEYVDDCHWDEKSAKYVLPEEVELHKVKSFL